MASLSSKHILSLCSSLRDPERPGATFHPMCPLLCVIKVKKSSVWQMCLAWQYIPASNCKLCISFELVCLLPDAGTRFLLSCPPSIPRRACPSPRPTALPSRKYLRTPLQPSLGGMCSSRRLSAMVMPTVVTPGLREPGCSIEGQLFRLHEKTPQMSGSPSSRAWWCPVEEQASHHAAICR